MRHYLLFICLLVLPSRFAFAQSIEEAYGLQFEKSSYFRYNSPYLPGIDSTQVTDDGFHPLRLQFDNNRFFVDYDLLYWSRIVVLPANTEKKECTVSLNCKTEIDSLRFIVIARDKEENALYTDSVIIHPTEQWADYTLTFRNPEARLVHIIICHKMKLASRAGSQFQKENTGRSIYLNKVNIRLGNQDLNNFPIASLVNDEDRKLKSEAIIPLSFQDQATLAGIQDWKDKKIIALGDPIHGIQDVWESRIQFTKYLITKENCKIVFLPLSQELCLRWNLYLQGKLPDLSEGKFIEEVKNSVCNSTSLFEFLKWIRQHNQQTSDPVRVAGIMDCGFPGQRSCLADYLLNFSTNRKDSLYYLNALFGDSLGWNRFSELKEHILQSQLPDVLNEKDFQYLLFILDRWHYRTRNLIGAFGSAPDRVSEQAKRIEQTIDIYLSETEKAVLIAPSAQINKRFPIHDLEEVESRIVFDRLGSYLYQRYGKQYYAVSFQIGKITCSDDSFLYQVGDRANWTSLFLFAFERAAMDCNIPYFYYPSDQLPDGILGINLFAEFSNLQRWRWRTDMRPFRFRYCHVASHFDALVFINEVNTIRDYNGNVKYSFSKSDDYLEGILNLDSLLEELKK